MWRVYLEDLAHQESPARAQLPSVARLRGVFLLCPGGGDVTQRREQRATGPGTDRQKTSVRKQKTNLLWFSHSQSGCVSDVRTLASSEFSLSLRSVIRLQFRQSAREIRQKTSYWISVSMHTSVLLMQSQKKKLGHCSYWTGALRRGRTGGEDWMVSSPPPELRAGLLHLQHNRNNCNYSALVHSWFMFLPSSVQQI